jgi:excisionase family DNA binding protein
VDEIMTPSEVASLLKIHVKTVYKLVEKGLLPGNRIGRSWRFSKSDILNLVSDKRKRGARIIQRSFADKGSPGKRVS